MKKALLISGGHIDDKYIKGYLKDRHYDITIAIDGGLEKAAGLGIVPTHVIGDFDTVSAETLKKYSDNESVKVIRLMPEKDFSDTQCAISTAIQNNCTHIEIIGGTGTRLDHTVANIHTLQMVLNKCDDAVIVNENNRIRLVNGRKIIERQEVFGRYISFLPLTDKVKGVCLKGFKYPLDNYEFDIHKSMSLGVSNELVQDRAEIDVAEGILIMVESED